MKVLVIGNKGLLGSEVMKSFSSKFDPVGVDIDDCNITQIDSIENLINLLDPKVIVNCAAYTNVDGAEKDSALAYLVNGKGPENLAIICHKKNILLIHFSTDYVFNGLKSEPYEIIDPPAPLNVYGKSKLVGEQAIMKRTDNCIIIRTSWLFGLSGKSFPATINTLIQTKDELHIVDDQRGCPTYAPDLAGTIEPLITSGYTGMLHCTNKGSATWYDMAKAILEFNKMFHIALHAISSHDLNQPATRPAYSVLNTSICDDLIGARRHWKDALHEFLDEV